MSTPQYNRNMSDFHNHFWPSIVFFAVLSTVIFVFVLPTTDLLLFALRVVSSVGFSMLLKLGAYWCADRVEGWLVERRNHD